VARGFPKLPDFTPHALPTERARLLAVGPMPARVMIISDAWLPQVNGVVRTLATISDELRRLGHTVEVVGPDRFRTLPLPTYPDIRIALLPKRRLGKLIEAFVPDALHIATEGPLGQAARAWAVKRGCAFTTAFHTRFPEYLHARIGVPPEWMYAWMRRFHTAGQGTMVATASLRDDLEARGFTHLRTWSRGVDLAQFRTELRDGGDPELDDLPRPLFLHVGRVAVEKNIRAFLDLDLPGSKAVVGGGPQLAELQRDYPAVRFTGPRHGEALARAYAQGDVFVFPSLTDTFGLVILEALACGTPVAAYPVTGPKDVLANPAGQVGAVHQDLRTACLAALHANRADARAHAETFSWKACAETFLSHLVPLGGH
jgi:glycosyltransferase involved in cell wall biosynthesis